LTEAELARLALGPGEVTAGVSQSNEWHRRCPNGELHEVLGLAGTNPGRAGVRASRQSGIIRQHRGRSVAASVHGSAHEFCLGEAAMGVNMGEHGAVAERWCRRRTAQ
jgi:hypothetical protein